MCDSSGEEKLIAALAVAALVLVFIVIPLLLIVRLRGHRLLATAIWLGALGLGVVLPLAAGDEDAVVGVYGAVAIAAAAAVVAAIWRRRPALAIAGVLGAAAPGVIVVVGFFAALILTETCLS